MNYKAPRGTRDILPEESFAWRFIIQTIIRVLTTYHYEEIQTPIFESADLFQRAVGDTTDIVEKEMYTFSDKGDRLMALRPEGTASIVRAYLQNGEYFQKKKLVKLFYEGAMFRYERPQTGRYRQFHQIGVEAIGSFSPLLDVESMMMGAHIFQELGLADVTLAVHSVGCDVCRPVIRERIKAFTESILTSLCPDCQTRFERNPLRILDCKNPTCQMFFTGMPNMDSALCNECSDHFFSVLNLLEANNVPHEVDSHLVRGLDYYTKTVFEIRSSVLGAQNAVCGGGRYDNLIAELGGRKTPAFGFAVGLDRLYMILKDLQLPIPAKPVVTFFVIGLGAISKEPAFKCLSMLRKKGIVADFCFKEGSINDGLREALLVKATYAVIIGENEVENHTFTLKNLKEKKQFIVHSLDEIAALAER